MPYPAQSWISIAITVLMGTCIQSRWLTAWFNHFLSIFTIVTNVTILFKEILEENMYQTLTRKQSRAALWWYPLKSTVCSFAARGFVFLTELFSNWRRSFISQFVCLFVCLIYLMIVFCARTQPLCAVDQSQVLASSLSSTIFTFTEFVLGRSNNNWHCSLECHTKQWWTSWCALSNDSFSFFRLLLAVDYRHI